MNILILNFTLTVIEILNNFMFASSESVAIFHFKAFVSAKFSDNANIAIGNLWDQLFIDKKKNERNKFEFGTDKKHYYARTENKMHPIEITKK